MCRVGAARFISVLLAPLLFTAAELTAQTTPIANGAGAPARALQLPQSGRASPGGSATVEQTPSSAGVETVNTSVQVSGDLAGSVPGAIPGAGPISLTIEEAVRRGLATNLGMITAGNSSALAAAQRRQALSALLPYISVNASETVTQVNLAAYGFQFNLPPNLGFSIPSVVGPFSYSQLQGSVSESIYDPVARRNLQASNELRRAAGLTAKDARELVVLAVAGMYLETIATGARIDSQTAQVANAEAVYKQARIRNAAGANARIDVTRTLVELQTEQQRLNALESDLRQQKLALAAAIGLPLDREITLAEPLASTTVPIPSAAEAIQQAFEHRADLLAAEAQVRAAQKALDAAHAEHLPSLSFNGDYGVLGPNPSQMRGVFAVTGSVNIPVWNGGSTKADIQQAEAALGQRQSELASQRRQVEQDVRAALIGMQTAAGQVKLAESNRAYAAETLREARDRLNLGVATTVEVVQAEQQAASAEGDYVSSLLSLDVSRLNLARASGAAETSLPDLLKGERP